MVDYQDLFTRSLVTMDPNRVTELGYVCGIALQNQKIYEAVSLSTTIPWPLVAAIHYRESDQNFKCHLHNGDPLTARTTHVPVGRPKQGEPPFTWTDSACDALGDLWRPDDWYIPGCLEFLERYNGMGYQKHGINTPYLWDYTSLYDAGLYVADGVFDPKARESRPGAVAILKSLSIKGVSLDFVPKDLLN